MAEALPQVYFRKRGDKFCIEHPKDELILLCKDCNETLVCTTCISSTHSGHKVVAIRLIIQEKFTHLKDLTTEIQSTKIPQIETNIKQADEAMKQTQLNLQDQIKKIEDHGKYLKELIVKSTTETVSHFKDIERKITKQFETFKSNSENTIKQLKDLIQESKEATKSSNDVLIIDTIEQAKAVSEHTPLLENIKVSMEFYKGTNSESNIKSAFGNVVHSKDENKSNQTRGVG